MQISHRSYVSTVIGICNGNKSGAALNVATRSREGGRPAPAIGVAVDCFFFRMRREVKGGCVFATGWHVDLNVGGAGAKRFYMAGQIPAMAKCGLGRGTRDETRHASENDPQGEPETGSGEAGPHSQASAGTFAMDTHLHSCSRPSVKALC